MSIKALPSALLLFLATSCSSTTESPLPDCPSGEEGCACLSDGTCASGLRCGSNLCVAFDGGLATGGAGGLSNQGSGGAGAKAGGTATAGGGGNTSPTGGSSGGGAAAGGSGGVGTGGTPLGGSGGVSNGGTPVGGTGGASNGGTPVGGTGGVNSGGAPAGGTGGVSAGGTGGTGGVSAGGTGGTGGGGGTGNAGADAGADSGSGGQSDASAGGGAGGVAAGGNDAGADSSVTGDASVDAGDSDAGGPPPLATSCSGDVGTECGGGSCCESLGVSGGAFAFGSDAACADWWCTDEAPEITSTVSPYWLDKYEVTVGRFRKFVAAYSGAPAAGAGAHPRIAGSGWDAAWDTLLPASSDFAQCTAGPAEQTYTATAGANEQKPVNCVSWYTAFAFCAWDGGRLPTELEWERAAANGVANDTYPWGAAAPTPSRAAYDCLGDGLVTCGLSDILTVGSLPAGASGLGHLDLSGNVAEWVLDTYSITASEQSHRVPEPCADCADLTPSTRRVEKGGDYRNGAEHIRSKARTGGDATSRYFLIGFRCARD